MSCYEDDCRVHEQFNIEQRRRRCWRLCWRWWWWWCLPPPVLHQSLLCGEKAFFCRKSLLTTQEWWPSPWLGTGHTETNLLLRRLKVKIISHQIFLFPCLSVCRQSQRLLAAFYGRLMRLPHFVHQRLLLQIHHTSHPFLCQINSWNFVYVYSKLFYWHISLSGWARSINVLAVSLEMYKQYLS